MLNQLHQLFIWQQFMNIDSPILDIDKNHLDRTYDPKVVGAYNLYKLSLPMIIVKNIYIN